MLLNIDFLKTIVSNVKLYPPLVGLNLMIRIILRSPSYNTCSKLKSKKQETKSCFNVLTEKNEALNKCCKMDCETKDFLILVLQPTSFAFLFCSSPEYPYNQTNKNHSLVRGLLCPGPDQMIASGPFIWCKPGKRCGPKPSLKCLFQECYLLKMSYLTCFFEE
ncbi:CLUMA_CG001569, isoform A [Clunio marinus]|uniref:CLUMA_CG001569, isoform A n=1 Tax=Clunio marinus TaxID=568069 RepID=A0A1J1HMX3_9DIPT|nr:CLUMA_CG001569, isoform A [Clunio marinus]